jgi:hypothetical protein
MFTILIVNIISGGFMKTTFHRKTYLKKLYLILLITFFIFSGSILLSGCGSSGGSSSPSSPSSPPPSGTSSSSQSGALGVAVVSGVTNIAAPAPPAGSSGTGYLTTLPNSGTLTGATVSNAQFQPISVPAITTTVNGTNLDCAHSVGAAFSYNSPVVAFFSFPAKCAASTATLSQVGSYTTTSANTLSISGGSPQIGGVVLDSANQWAVVSTGDGYQIISYSNPAAPTFIRTISSSAVNSTTGIDMAENFAYDATLKVGATTYPMILSSTSDDNSASSGNWLEFADAGSKTGAGTIYKPDTATQGNFNAAFSSSASGGTCGIDQIGIDTNYQVAVIGCEWASVGALVNLNAMTLTAPTTAGGDGTYSLPASAIYVFKTGGDSGVDNVAVESNTHTVFMGDGGYMSPYDAFMVGVLSNPSTALGFTTTPVITTMPVTSSSNIANCTYSGCNPIPLGVSWTGAKDPHANAAYYTPASTIIVRPASAWVLWMHNTYDGIAVINATAVLNPSSFPAGYISIWYQGIP